MDALIRRMKAIGETKPVMRALQFSTIHEAQKRVPRKTGNLQRSIGPGRLTDDVAEVVAKMPYAAAVEYGSRPHVIVPKRAKVLAWGGSRRLSGRLRSGASADTFAMRVNHPGNKPKPYLVPGAKEAIHKAGLDELVNVWNRSA